MGLCKIVKEVRVEETLKQVMQLTAGLKMLNADKNVYQIFTGPTTVHCYKDFFMGICKGKKIKVKNRSSGTFTVVTSIDIEGITFEALLTPEEFDELYVKYDNFREGADKGE